VAARTRFSRAYIRHLVNQQGAAGSGPQPANLRHLLTLTAGARAAIQAGRLADFDYPRETRLRASRVSKMNGGFSS
jgi:queuine/archaeosine tRNA-ribosyltransferase